MTREGEESKMITRCLILVTGEVTNREAGETMGVDFVAKLDLRPSCYFQS